MPAKKVKTLQFKSYQDIKTFEDACAVLGLNPMALPVVDGIDQRDHQSVVAYYKLTIIIRALNYDFDSKKLWEPDYSNPGQWKYYLFPWIKADKKNPAGVGFSRFDCDDSGTRSDVGSRLMMRDSARVEYAYNNFQDLYKKYLLLV